ncbi:ABC-three component system protein [Acidaminococcus fermentans]|uniref:ABC-three component system protein n=1 Tax=Acidaminococcus fermentans TaxID=905 RepID=UPI003F8C9F1A
MARIFYGIPYANGFQRLASVTSQAAVLPISRSQIALLPGWIGAAEKIGMCHMIVNRKELQWVDEDDGTV